MITILHTNFLGSSSFWFRPCEDLHSDWASFWVSCYYACISSLISLFLKLAIPVSCKPQRPVIFFPDLVLNKWIYLLFRSKRYLPLSWQPWSSSFCRPSHFQPLSWVPVNERSRKLAWTKTTGPSHMAEWPDGKVSRLSWVISMLGFSYSFMLAVSNL